MQHDDDMHAMLVEVLRLVNEHERRRAGNPLPDLFVLQKRRRQTTRPIKFIQGGGLFLHRLCNQAPAPCRERASKHIERLAIKAPANSVVLAKARIKAAARAVHKGERQELVPVTQSAVLN